MSAYPAPLAGAEVYEWIALRRVGGGGVAKVGDRWLQNGHRVPGYVAGALAGLLAGGLVMPVDPEPSAVARVALTDAGTDRYEQLCQQALRMPGAQFIDLCRRFVDEVPDPVGARRCPTRSPAGRRLSVPRFGPAAGPPCHNASGSPTTTGSASAPAAAHLETLINQLDETCTTRRSGRPTTSSTGQPEGFSLRPSNGDHRAVGTAVDVNPRPEVFDLPLRPDEPAHRLPDRAAGAEAQSSILRIQRAERAERRLITTLSPLNAVTRRVGRRRRRSRGRGCLGWCRALRPRGPAP
ncbi:MAG: hypothetical protein JO268_12935 [Pseudonocardiales bacterium]|nr:hypothetical protein [Pseudonocardiales bacterium]